MAAPEIVNPNPIVAIVETSCPEPVKESNLDNLMEKLRSKSGLYRSWPEMSKSLRVAITEKRHLMSSGDRTQLQKVLDTLQKSIKVTSFQSMAERVESISRQVQGVRFSNRYPTPELYIYNDMFYVEIILEMTGAVKDVKINHHAESTATVTCPELVKVLKAGNFSEFTKHVEGLASIYQLNAEKMQKSQAFLALQALETDLGMLAQLKSSVTEPRNLVHNSPVGILQKRRGGYSLKLTYFISPYDLLDVETKASLPLTAETVIEKGLGQSVTVCIESSTAHKLQTTSLITITKTSDGRSQPQFAALSNLNSTILPANFVLKLPKPIPMATSLVKEIQNVTLAKIPDCGDLSSAPPLVSVIIKDTSNGKLSAGDQGLWVTLPDQQHCYFLNSSCELQGVMVSSIPFTHPTHVPQILVFLRQQMLFNTVISSCIRPHSKQDAESPYMFEGMAYSTSHILVSFEHPLEESLATVDIDLKDINKVSCKIYTLSSDATMCTDDYASKVLQRCLSIPITMRAVIRKAQGQQQLMRSSSQGDTYCPTVSSGASVFSHIPNYGNSLTNGSSFAGGDFSNLASRMCNKDSGNISKMTKTAAMCTTSENQGPVQTKSETDSSSLEDDANNSSARPDSSSDKSKNSNANNPLQQKRHSNVMLMSMLSDMPSANASFPFLAQGDNSNSKSRKRKKRCSNRSPSSSTGRSPKRKMSEDDYVRDRSTPDGEICDSPLAYEACSSLPASLPSDQHITHTIGSVEAIIKSEQSPAGYPQRSASTDGYLMHEEFPSHQILNINDASRMSEGNSQSNPDLVRNFSQVKPQYFPGDSIMDIKSYLAATEAGFVESLSSDIDVEDDNSLSLDSSHSSNLMAKSNSSEKSIKKKSKERLNSASDMSDVRLKTLESISSDESSVGDSQKSFNFNDPENSHPEESSKSSGTHSQMFLSTSLKIAKSADGLKVSKSKQKDSKRSSDASETKKKSDAKKERKRRKAESQGSSSSRSPVRSFHLNIDSSLMPPPSSSSETTVSTSSSDTQPIRPITLNVKASPIVSSSSNSQSKSPVYSKKSSSLSSSSSNVSKSSSKSGSEKSIKPSPPKSSIKGSDPDSKRSSSSSVKVPSKHKQSMSSKSSSGSSGSHSTGRSSPSKPKSGSIKLKSYPLPPSVTLTPIDSKVSSSPTSGSNVSSDVLTIQAMAMNPTSPTGKSGSNSSKASKAALRSRSLNAVIDKLTSTAVNAQHILPDGTESFKGSDITVERKEGKLDRKEVGKDSRDLSLASKTSENKPKYSSSDQFTVKQSSQGIKLSITKTRTTDGSSKTSKSKQSSKNSSNMSGNVGKASSSSSGVSKSGNLSPAAKKMYPPNLNSSPKSSSTKQNPATSHKISSPSSGSSMSPRHGSSANNLSKSMSKHVSSSQSKLGGPVKLFDKSDKKVISETKPIINEIKDNVTMIVGNMMPPPHLSKPINDQSRPSSSGNTPKRTDDTTRQSPRHTPTREVVCLTEPDEDRAYRILLNQSKNDPSNGSEIGCKSNYLIYNNDYSKLDLVKSELEEKSLWVSSSSDIKLSHKFSQELIIPDDINCIQLNEKEMSSSRYDGIMGTNLVSSSEEISRHMKSRLSDEESSPDLIIDCDSEDAKPRLPQSNMVSIVLDDKMEREDSSPGTFALSQSFLLKSPAQILTPSNHSLSFNNRIEIDDDLMDEAVMPVEK